MVIQIVELRFKLSLLPEFKFLITVLHCFFPFYMSQYKYVFFVGVVQHME